ncbi:MAG TPA: hypothetical protein VK524_12930 [Polyangiaceae bacterium]|nr:hypothetical protein [Polyangiaceae bacterium]
MRRSEQFIASIREEFPKFRIVEKRTSAFSMAIHVTLCVLTFGGQRAFLSQYHTVIGDTLYVPDAWARSSEVDRVILLRHELIHMRQRRRYGFLGMAFLYLIPFFPIGLAYGRARLEWEAYRETLRATAELLGLPAAHDPALRSKIIERFVGPAYGWMWPFRTQIERWYDRALADLGASFTRAELSGSSGQES